MVLRTIRVEIVDFPSNSSPRARIPRTARVARGVREMRARGDFFLVRDFKQFCVFMFAAFPFLVSLQFRSQFRRPNCLKRRRASHYIAAQRNHLPSITAARHRSSAPELGTEARQCRAPKNHPKYAQCKVGKASITVRWVGWAGPWGGQLVLKG